jgi:hypothetical protein
MSRAHAVETHAVHFLKSTSPLNYCAEPFSLLFLQICTHSDFELMVMLLIFANCVSLALYDPLQAEDNQHNGTLTKLGAQGSQACSVCGTQPYCMTCHQQHAMRIPRLCTQLVNAQYVVALLKQG